MTVTYTGRVANARLCAFSRLLFCWKGSIYKLVYKEMLIFCLLYTLFSCVYRVALNEDQRLIFEKIVLYCQNFTDLIPLSFVLGFYVSVVVTRWWSQYMSIPWPDRVMLFITTMIDGADETSRIIRRNLMRYMTLSSLIVFQATSVRIKKRFPTFDHLIEAGIVTKAEVKMLDDINTPHGKWWVPFVWCCNLVREAKRQGRIADNYLMKTLITEINQYRGSLGMLYSYDWISVPLVYTQVTTLAVYTFFFGCTVGRQFIDPSRGHEGHEVDLYVPLFTLLQFFFYMGWLKVAEQLINPFGEDDDDFEMNWIIDRNLQISWLTTDDLYGQFPPLEKDVYFGEPPPDYLPYTKSSVKSMSKPHMGSTADLRISDEDMKVLSPLETIQEGVALTNAVHINIPPSNIGTPRRFGGGGSTPANCSHGIRMSQNLMSGFLSPSGIRSHASRVSVHSSAMPDGDYDIGGMQLQESGPVQSGSSVVTKVTEKLGRWLMHHRSQAEDLNLGRSYSSAYGGTCDLLSRQTSASDDIHRIDFPSTEMQSCWTPTIGSRPGPLPPLAELFSPQSMFVEDSKCMGSPSVNIETPFGSIPDRDVHDHQIPATFFLGLSNVYGHDRNRRRCNGGFLEDGEQDFSLREVGDMNGIHTDVVDRKDVANCAIMVTAAGQNSNDCSQQTAGLQDMATLSAAEDGKSSADAGVASRFLTVLVPDATHDLQHVENLGSSPGDSDHDGCKIDYDPPESHQCSVTSMTPLLTNKDGDDDDEDGETVTENGMLASSDSKIVEESSTLPRNHVRHGTSYPTLAPVVAVQ